MTTKNTDSPNLEQVMRVAFESLIGDVHVALPGKIETWDPVTQRANVKPLVQRVYYTFDRERIVEALPVITKVPVLFPRSEEMFISFPIKKGDHVELHFNSKSIDQFLSKKGEDTDPLDTRHHHLSDAVAYVGMYPDSKQLVDVHPTNLVIGKDDGGFQMHIDPGADEVLLGGASISTFMARADRVETGLQNIVDAIKGGVPVASDGGAALQTSIVALLTDPVASTAADKVKGD